MSECLGVGLIGPVVIVYGITTSLLSFLAGRMSVYTSRTAIGLFSGFCQLVLIVFLLVWERRPSYYMVFASAAIQGSINGMFLPLPTSLYILENVHYFPFPCTVHLHLHIGLLCLDASTSTTSNSIDYNMTSRDLGSENFCSKKYL